MELVDQEESALTSGQISTLMSSAQSAIGSIGGQCKVWVQNIVSSSLGITVPTNAANLYEWNGSASVVQRAQWRGSYAIGRFDTSVAAWATYNGNVNLPNGDPYVLVLYGTGVSGEVYNSAGTRVAGPITASSSGVISSTFSGAGAYSVRVRNNTGSAVPFVAVVLSRSRFVSDFESAWRGDAIQMYFRPGASATPHTTLVQTNLNSGSNNWIDSNWNLDERVTQHTVSVDQMIRWTARSSSYGFTVYRLQ